MKVLPEIKRALKDFGCQCWRWETVTWKMAYCYFLQTYIANSPTRPPFFITSILLLHLLTDKFTEGEIVCYIVSGNFELQCIRMKSNAGIRFPNENECSFLWLLNRLVVDHHSKRSWHNLFVNPHCSLIFLAFY